MKKSFMLLVGFTVLCFSCLYAQPSLEKDILDSYQHRKKLFESSLLKNYPARNIGPTIQGGRIVDIDVNQKNTKEFYIGFASAGLFKTVNNGITFHPVFDNNDALGIGDFALSQTDPNILYVGTGEKNSSRSSYAGSGVYKTTDGGKTWTHLGLTSTQHISRVIIHPTDNNTVWVAAIGPLYTLNAERGLFKTTDGGKTWKKTLFINDSTGVIDLAIDSKNPNHLLAATWQRSRTSWNFKGNGQHCAIYRSEDGGETWKRSLSGFPQGNIVGRIGLEISVSNPNIAYAILDSQREIKEKKENQSGEKLQFDDFEKMTNDVFLKLEDSKLDAFLKDNNFPKKYSAAVVKKDVKEGKYTPRAIGDYYGRDENKRLFDTKIAGAELYRSEDGGITWKRMNSDNLDGVFFTYGYYFSEMKVSTDNPDLIYIYGVPLLKSRDGGATWHRIDTLKGIKDIHVDHHALWVNPHDSKHLLLGNDGGLYQSYDEGANWLHIENLPAGQFYTVNVDMETPYNVYGGLQDNGIFRGSSKSIPDQSKHWHSLFGGDGMYVAVDPRNSKLVYTGYQFGNYFKLELEKAKSTKITPQHDIGEQPLRWNWRVPLLLSKHNPDIVYTAAHKVFRSMNKADDWKAISGDLTKNIGKQGNVPFSTISSLAESPLKFGLLYVGTDDGNLWVSQDAGGQWTPIQAGLPENKWISSISPSPHDEATVFISLNGYREDNFKTDLWMSTDYGKTWKSIKGNLPESVANVVIQDPVNADLLYCGLDNGTYASLDKGNTWHPFNQMLNVASYDMIVHPRENELVVGSHGRSVFVADVKPLQALKDGGINKGIIAFEPESVVYNDKWGTKQYSWDNVKNPKVNMMYYTGKPAQNAALEIYDEKNNLVRKLDIGTVTVGFHMLTWDVKVNKPESAIKAKDKKKSVSVNEMKYAEPGKYKLKFISGQDSSEVTLTIKEKKPNTASPD